MKEGLLDPAAISPLKVDPFFRTERDIQDDAIITRLYMDNDDLRAPEIVINQSQDPVTAVHIRKEKAGPFAVIETSRAVYIGMPGSVMTLPDVRIEMQGEAICGKEKLTVSPTPRPAQTITDQAMILGAGLASRFVPFSGDLTGFSKPAVPLIGEDSVIVCLAKHLKSHGIKKIIVNTFYKPDILKAQLDAVADGDLTFVYVDEDKPSGTAGGLTKALEAGLVDPEKPVLIVQGDAVTNADFSALLETHAQIRPLATLGVKLVPDEEVPHMAIIETDRSGDDGESGYIRRYVEKPALADAGESRLGSIGFYVLDPEVFSHFTELCQSCWADTGEYDYALNFFPSLLPTGDLSRQRLYARLMPMPFYWSDIGRPDQYMATVCDIMQGKLGIPLPEGVEAGYEDGIVFWPGAREAATADGIQLSGNILVASKPV